ncbi:MAG TPA: ornithine--oxo-acid transaminase [Candidatus Eisenbacteria bacterium]|nr:ornithine--oxo-acid transaminase [Candidatus Eisenbacteria bacterium]
MRSAPPDPRAFLELEATYSAHNYHPLDVVLERGEGVWVWDVDGRRYMDLLSAYGAVNQGHNHPRIVEAMITQARRLALTSRAFRNDRFGPFCKKLCDLLGYEKALLMNSGAEAVETAIKAARRWGYRRKGVPGDRAEILVFENNFHGRTTTIVGFSTDSGTRADFGPFAPGFRTLPYGDADAAARAMHGNVVGVLVEPIQGEAGVIVPPKGFLRRLRELCDEHRALLLVDEIQSGLGRTGKLLAQEHEGVRADGVIIGKALSGGLYPVSAFLADDEVMGVFDPGSHGSTYGGNPLACAVADAALGVIVDEGLVERARELGEHLEARVFALRSPRVKASRVAGLWAGIELHPDAGGARRYTEGLRAKGFLCKETHTHTIRIAPPLVISRPELDAAMDAVAAVLS